MVYRDGRYFVAGIPTTKAMDAGLTLATRYSTLEEQVYVTEEPMAALPFWSIAKRCARDRLEALHTQYQRSFSTEPWQASDIPVPDGLTYAPYQLAGIDYALDREHALFGDDPGLGKTVEALGVANAIGANRILIICPAAVRIQWGKMARTWLVDYTLRIHVALKSSHGVNPAANVVILSYDLARTAWAQEVLTARRWDLLILDEAHYLKNHTASRTTAILGRWDHQGKAITDAADKILALTGTPMPNRPREIYAVGRCLDWSSLNFISEDEFFLRYNAEAIIEGKRKDGTPYIRKEERVGRLPELQAMLRVGFMVRRAKRSVLVDLPPKRYELTYVEETGAIREALEAEKLLQFDPDEMDKIPIEIQGAIATVRKQMGIAKVPSIVGHINVTLEGGVDKVVVFAYHREVIRLLQEELRKYKPVVVTGSTSMVGRETAKLIFVRDPKCRVFLGQIDAAGTGIDGLQDVCSWAIVAEPSWVPGVIEQAGDRLDRMGQTRGTVIQLLVAEGSLDERILAKVVKKQQTTDVALDRRASHE
jgi:SWI/SNF-related matrix-associated actin-dependent regulator 1 of chromatin subfamily A